MAAALVQRWLASDGQPGELDRDQEQAANLSLRRLLACEDPMDGPTTMRWEVDEMDRPTSGTLWELDERGCDLMRVWFTDLEGKAWEPRCGRDSKQWYWEPSKEGPRKRQRRQPAGGAFPWVLVHGLGLDREHGTTHVGGHGRGLPDADTFFCLTARGLLPEADGCVTWKDKTGHDWEGDGADWECLTCLRARIFS